MKKITTLVILNIGIIKIIKGDYMVDVSFKYPRSGALIYRTYPDLKSTPKEIKYNGKMYLLYGVHREYDNPQ